MSIDRRSFIKLTAVSGGAAAIAACGPSSPENQLIRFIPDEDLTPGIAELKNGVCPICRAGCGTTVRVMQGDAEVVRNGQAGVMTMSLAKKLEGNASHPISQGALCPRGQASIQITYHPDRLIEPLKRRGARGSGDYQPVSWDAAIAELAGHLDGLASPNGLAALTRPGASSRNDLIAMFVEKFGGQAPVTYELFSDAVLRRANLVAFGREQVPTFDFANAHLVISFGADFLGTWNSPVSQMAAYAKMRGGRPGIRGSLIQIEPRMSLTGASADEWIAIKPGTEGVLALGLARALGGKDPNLAPYTPAEVERLTGVKATRVERLAATLRDRKPAVAVIAGAPLAHTNGLFQAMAVGALNTVLGAVEAPGGLSFMPQIENKTGSKAPRALQALVSDILGGKGAAVQMLLVDGVNPVHTTPPGWKVKDALAKVPYIVSFGNFADDTSVMADLILPDHSFLETWTDARPETGTATPIVTVAGPAMKPLHNTRATEDVLLEVAKKLKKPLSVPASFEEMLKASVGSDEAWSTAQKQGWVEIRGQRLEARGQRKNETRRTNPSNPQSLIPNPEFDGDATQYPFHFLPFASQAFLDGSTAHLPWLQEMPDPISTAMWSTWAEINPQTAARLGIADGDMIEIASAHGAIHAPALLSPGIAPDIIAMPAGQGHETFTRYASGRGSNPVKVLAPVVEPETGALAWAATRVKITRVSEANGELIRYGGALRESEPHR